MSDAVRNEGFVTTKEKRRVAWTAEGPLASTPLVLVHASGMSGRAWQGALSRFRGERRVVTLDLVGYGRSDPLAHGEAFGCDEDLGALMQVIDAQRGPVDLVGHSYGGYLAARAAARTRVRSVMLVEPVLFAALRATDDELARAELASLYDDPTFLDPATGGSEAWMQRFIDYWTGSGAWVALAESHRRANLRVAWKVFSEVRDLSFDGATFADYAPLAAVSTLVGGSRTTIAAKQVLAHLARIAPHAQLASIEGAGHMSPLTHADAFHDLLARHLERADAQR